MESQESCEDTQNRLKWEIKSPGHACLPSVEAAFGQGYDGEAWQSPCEDADRYEPARFSRALSAGRHDSLKVYRESSMLDDAVKLYQEAFQSSFLVVDLLLVRSTMVASSLWGPRTLIRGLERPLLSDEMRLSSLSNLGNCLFELGRLDEARPLLEETLEKQSQLRGEKRLEVKMEAWQEKGVKGHITCIV